MSHSSASPPRRGASASTDYVPVPCSFHDVLEDAAVRRTVRAIRFQDEQGRPYEVRTTIDDVWSKAGEEFARLGSGHVVRLDRLELLDGRSGTSLRQTCEPRPTRPEEP